MKPIRVNPFPRKRFGQHFLCDQQVIEQIVAALAPKADEHLIEIGPGQGALTVPILKLIPRLEAIELDRDVITVLKERSQHVGEIEIYSEDALKFDFAKLKKDQRQLRIFGNLPYNISTPLIFHLLDYADIISDMLFMLQKEVAERIADKASGENYGRLSVMVQYHCEVELLFNVPKQAFYPQPKVQSSIIRLIPYKKYPFVAKNYAMFETIVRHAFNQRRKTLRNSLKGIVSDTVWTHISMHSDRRAEELSVKDFVDIANALNGK